MGYPSLFHGMLSTLPTVHQDPHTCLLQGPVLHVCVLAVFLIWGGNKKPHITHCKLNPALRPRAHLETTFKKQEGQSRGMTMRSV